MFRWDSIRSIRSRPNDNEVKSAYWPSAAVNPHQPSLRAFKVRSTNASLRSAARMLMQRQALLSQVDGGMAMWHAVKRCISPSIPKFWPENLEFGAGPKITIIEETSQTTSTSDIFDMFCFLSQCKNPRSLDGFVLEMLSIRYPELHPFSYIAPTLATPQGPSSASQCRLLETCLGRVV